MNAYSDIASRPMFRFLLLLTFASAVAQQGWTAMYTNFAVEVVRVTDGPFNDFSGVVEQVNYEKNRIQVGVQILGRSTPVELDFGQVEKS